MTLNEIEVLIANGHKQAHAGLEHISIAMASVHLCTKSLLKLDVISKEYVLTERGKAYLKMLNETPLPEKKIIYDANGKLIFVQIDPRTGEVIE